MIQLRFNGFGAGFFPEFGNTSAWFVNQGDFFLIDCGEDVFQKVYQRSEYRKAKHIFAVITHMHTDHVGSLGELAAYSWFCLHKKITIVYPDSRIRQYLELCGIHKELYHWQEGGLERENIRIVPEPVVHDPCMGCFGYRIYDGEEAIYYSGDSRAVEQEIAEQLKDGSLSRLYLDTSKHAAPDSGHGCFEILKQRISPGWRQRVVCMHLDCDFCQEIIAEGFGCAAFSPSSSSKEYIK